MQEQQVQATLAVGPMMEAAGIPWWGIYLGTLIASALVAYLCVLITKGLVKAWRQRDHKVKDPWWWQWGWRLFVWQYLGVEFRRQNRWNF